MVFFQNGLTPPSLLEFSSHFFQNSLTKNFKNNFFTVFNLLAHWHLFGIDCFRTKKSDSKLLGRPRPPPFWKNTIKSNNKKSMASLSWSESRGSQDRRQDEETDIQVISGNIVVKPKLRLQIPNASFPLQIHASLAFLQALIFSSQKSKQLLIFFSIKVIFSEM